MAIVDIGAVSGFEPQKDKVEMSPLIKRLEMPGNRLIIYFDEVGNSYNTFASVFTIKRPKDASAARARGDLIVKILKTCILSTLVYTLFLVRQRNSSYTSQYFLTPVYWLSS